MTQPKRPLKVFLCHAHSDKNAVRDLYLRLTNDGVDAWLDKAKLLPGQDWELEIKKAVREADVVVVCLSKQFNQAGFRQKEVRLALDTAMEKPEGEIFIIPARLEECETLESLRKWHWVDLFENEGYEMLMRALRARANKIGAVLQSQSDSKIKSETSNTDTGRSVIKRKSSDRLHSPKNRSLTLQETVTGLIQKHKLLQSLAIVTVVLTLSLFALWFAKNISTRLNAAPTTTSISSLTEITDDKGVPMRLIPADMVDATYIDAYYVDKYEVTNAFYKLCVDAGWCLPPKKYSSKTRSAYYNDPQFNDYPVVNIDWSMASAYCKYRNAQLPTMEQWTVAGQGTDKHIYPWGEGIDSTYANYNNNVGDTSPVGSYEKGRSIYGLYDMVGNVAELTEAVSGGVKLNSQMTPSPLGTTVWILGGSWANDSASVRLDHPSYSSELLISGDEIGFRCAKPAP